MIFGGEHMVIDDPIYGRVVLDATQDALLIDLIQSPVVQRLKQVLQHGISAVNGLALSGAAVTRFAHSVGACLLVRRLGADIECQAAALLHDAAHTSLSHTVDHAFGRVVHEQDKWYYLQNTSIPQIITRHGFEPKRVLEECNFSLLERDAPALCADRLDYGLRDAFAFGILKHEEVQMILDDIHDLSGEIVCSTPQIARLLSDAYMAADQFAWSNPTHAVLYKYAAEAIREAYNIGQISLDDLWSTCEVFWSALQDSPISSVRTLARRVQKDLVVEELSTGEEPAPGAAIESLELKPRTLDPTVVVNGLPLKLSVIDGDYAQRVSEYRTSKKGCRRFQVTRQSELKC